MSDATDGNGFNLEVGHQKLSVHGLLGVLGLLVLMLSAALGFLVWNVVVAEKAIIDEHQRIQRSITDSLNEIEYVMTLSDSEAKALRQKLSVPLRFRQNVVKEDRCVTPDSC